MSKLLMRPHLFPGSILAQFPRNKVKVHIELKYQEEQSGENKRQDCPVALRPSLG